jgi:hypothetical protein
MFEWFLLSQLTRLENWRSREHRGADLVRTALDLELADGAVVADSVGETPRLRRLRLRG